MIDQSCSDRQRQQADIINADLLALIKGCRSVSIRLINEIGTPQMTAANRVSSSKRSSGFVSRILYERSVRNLSASFADTG